MEFNLPLPVDIEIMALRAGMTMAQVCHAAGIQPSTFSTWKHGHKQPRLDTVRKLLSVFDPKKDAAE